MIHLHQMAQALKIPMTQIPPQANLFIDEQTD
jgi:hypothetical protein